MWISEEIVLTEFERMFSRWIQVKRQLDADLRALDSESDASQLDGCLHTAQKSLLGALTAPIGNVGSISRVELANLEKMKYAVAVYWDDYLLQRYDWGGLAEAMCVKARKLWLKNLIEIEIFGTRSAGKRFPHAVRDLLLDKRFAEADIPLLAVYLRILWLGFGSPEASSQVAYKPLREEAVRLLQSKYAVSSESKNQQPLGWMPPVGMQIKHLAPIQRWKKILLGTFGGLLASSLLIWIAVVTQLSDFLSRVSP